MQQCQSTQGMADARGGEDGPVSSIDGLIGLQRAANDFTEEWERAREPGAEGRAALVAIESLRALTLRTMAALSARAEPVSTEDLGRLALTLQRIERADRLRIEREQAVAEAGAQADPCPRKPLSREEDVFGWPAEAEAPDAEWTEDSGWGSGITPPAPAPDPPADDGQAQDAWDAPVAPRVSDPREAPDPWSPRPAQKTPTTPEPTDAEVSSVPDNGSEASDVPDKTGAPMAHDVRDARGPPDARDLRDAPDEREWSVVRDLEMRRRDAARLLGPAGAPF